MLILFVTYYLCVNLSELYTIGKLNMMGTKPNIGWGPLQLCRDNDADS